MLRKFPRKAIYRGFLRVSNAVSVVTFAGFYG